jgi:hypothetical protein
MANPRRPPGRPPLPAGEDKRHPLSFRATTPLRDALVRASQAAGHPLAQEIETRLVRSLADDLQQSEIELEVDRVLADLKPFVVQFLSRWLEAGGDPNFRRVLEELAWFSVSSELADSKGQPTEPEPAPEPEPRPTRKSPRS